MRKIEKMSENIFIWSNKNLEVARLYIMYARKENLPEGVRNRAEVRVVEIGLSEVDRTREENDADKQEEDKQSEFAQASFQSLAKNLQAFAMTTELEDAKDAHQSNDSEDGQCHGLVTAAAGASRVSSLSELVRF